MLLCRIFTRSLTALTLLLLSLSLKAQELFPINQPASVLPKHTLGIRFSDIDYKEVDQYRNIFALKLMYGVTNKLTVTGSAVVSNYHQKDLPFDFINHNHDASGGLTYSEGTPKTGIKYPYIFDGVDLYAQYRFFSSDGQNSHFRMAAYGEASYIQIQSHVTEPTLMDHTSGLGAGIISTYLKKHFAASFTTGFILPKSFNGNSLDTFGGIYPTKIDYGKAFIYNLSLGYLLYPHHYKNYDQTNWNIYMEFIGKTYGAANVSQKDGPLLPDSYFVKIPSTSSGLRGGNYIEMDPGIQCILKSNLRIDFSVGFPLVNKSYAHLYPLYMVGIQRYFYPKQKHT